MAAQTNSSFKYEDIQSPVKLLKNGKLNTSQKYTTINEEEEEYFEDDQSICLSHQSDPEFHFDQEKQVIKHQKKISKSTDIKKNRS